MDYRVEVTPRAAVDVDEAAAYIRQHSPRAARRWYEGLSAAILSLEQMPQRCATAPESERLGVELRQLIYGKRAGRFRIVFRIYPDLQPPVVRVVAVRHGARDRLTVQDFDDID